MRFSSLRAHTHTTSVRCTGVSGGVGVATIPRQYSSSMCIVPAVTPMATPSPHATPTHPLICFRDSVSANATQFRRIHSIASRSRWRPTSSSKSHSSSSSHGAPTIPRLSALSGLSPSTLYTRLIPPHFPVAIRESSLCDGGGDDAVAPSSGSLGLFTTRKVDAGEVLFEEVPIACVRLPQDEEEGGDGDGSTHSGAQQRSMSVRTAELCALCQSPLYPPRILAQHSADDPVLARVLSPDDIWQRLTLNDALMKQLGLDRERTPLTRPVACSACTSALAMDDHAASSASPSSSSDSSDHDPSRHSTLIDRYCSKHCAETAWNSFHAHEHLGTGDDASVLQRFDNEEMHEAMQQTRGAGAVISILMRIVAMMKAQQQQRRRGTHHSSNLTLFDHLSHLSCPTMSFFHPSHVAAIEHAFVPFFQPLIEGDDALRQRLENDFLLTAESSHHSAHDLDTSSNSASLISSEQLASFLVRRLVYALGTNLFTIARAPADLLLCSNSSSRVHVPGGDFDEDGNEFEILVRHPALNAMDEHGTRVHDDDDASRFTHYAALYSIATFMNHACPPLHNVAIESDAGMIIPPSSIIDSDLSSTLLNPPGSTPPTRFVALRGMDADEELLWNYGPAHEMRRRYGFTCRCAICMGRKDKKIKSSRQYPVRRLLRSNVPR